MIDRLCNAVDGSRMMAFLGELARWVKLSGTPEELESLRFVQRSIESYGYRTTLLMHDAYISLPGRARVVVNGADIRCITHSFSRTSPEGGLRAPLVYVGKGAAEDFARVDVNGKIVLMDGIAMPDSTQRAGQAGAVGQIQVSPQQHLHEMCVSPVWGSPTDATCGNLPRTVICTIPEQDGIALRERLARGEQLEAVLHAEVDTRWRQTPILVAEISGPDGGVEEPFVMFSGHHDTWHYGVMDNGSANATMLEVARLLATERSQWRRGLRLCFWSGHSHGRYSGSTWYADNHWEELARRCVAHVNVDSTGGKTNDFLADAPAALELQALAREAIKARAGQALIGKRMPRAGDQSFGGIGLPAMFMSVSHQPPDTKMKGGIGLGWWWHTPEDLLDKIDEPALVRDTRVYVHTLGRLLTDAILPLDYVAHADALLHELAGLRTEAIDLSSLTDAAERLRDRALALRERADTTNADIVNRALVAVSRALVPIDSTSGDRFGHDPATHVPSWPALAPLRALASAPHGSDQAKFLAVAATRARNRFVHALNTANAAIERTLLELAR